MYLPLKSAYMQILQLRSLYLHQSVTFVNYIHDIRRSHFWRRRSLLNECSMNHCWVIFYDIITEFHTSFILLNFLFQLRIFSSDIFSSLKRKWTFPLFLCVSRMIPFLLPISHGLSDTFIPISCCPSNDSFTPNRRSWLQFPASYQNEKITLDCRNIISLSLSKVLCIGTKYLSGSVLAADLRLLLLNLWCGICSETLSDALSW